MRILSTGPSASARLHLAALRVAAAPLIAIRGRGAGRVANALGHLFPADNFVVVEPFGPGAQIELALSDGYWMRHVIGSQPYEHDLHGVLDRLLHGDVAFVDCGANIGWWSVFAATRVAPGHVVAVEASASLFVRLAANARRNHDAFTPVHAAVWHESGIELRLATDRERHAWGSIDPTIRDSLLAQGFADEPVRSITVDDLVEQYTPGTQRYTIAKLDVEGAEVAALRSCTALLRDGIVVFEDHGRDPTAEVTRFVMEDLGLAVFACAHDGALVPLTDIDVVRQDLREPLVGYNFVAARPSSPGHDDLLALG